MSHKLAANVVHAANGPITWHKRVTGRLSSYAVVKELHEAVDGAAVYLARRVPVETIDQHLPSRQIEHMNQSSDKFVIKSVRGHWRLRNEANVLKRYQSRTPFLRPLVDEIQEPADPSSIVLRYLDSDMLVESNKKRLSRPEIKQVARCVLEALFSLETAEALFPSIQHLLEKGT